MDINSDGQDEIVLAAWNGQTYVVTQELEVMEFAFEDVISTFACGLYTVDEHTNTKGELVPKATVPVFVYVTFNHQIYIYHQLKVVTGKSVRLVSMFSLFTLILFAGNGKCARVLKS